MELHETLAQQAFIARQKRRRRMVTICRILLLFILLALWEICARFDIINDFIFSSPSRIILCFLSMVKDGSIFLHTGVTIMETLVKLLPCRHHRPSGRHSVVVQQEPVGYTGAVPCHAQQSAKICAGSDSDCLVRQ